VHFAYLLTIVCFSSTAWTRPDSNFLMLHADMSMLKNYDVSGPFDEPSCTTMDECTDAPSAHIVSISQLCMVPFVIQ